LNKIYSLHTENDFGGTNVLLSYKPIVTC